MPKVKFLNENRELEANLGESILEMCERLNIHLEHACGGVCACSTCHVYIKEGGGNVSPLTDEEDDRLDRAPLIQLNSRLGCQSKILGDIAFEIPLR